MKVVRLCGSSFTDLYAVLSQEDWEGGMPEGLAHWDGMKWEWVKRFDYSFTRILKKVEDDVYVLDLSGRISRLAPDGKWTTMKAPEFGYTCMWPYSPDDIVVGGLKGKLLRFSNSSWQEIETASKEDLTFIYDAEECLFVGGYKDTFFYFDRSTRHRIECDPSDYPCQMDEGKDKSLFVAAGSFDHGTLIRLDHNDGWHTRRYEAAGSLFSLAVLDENEVYCVTSYKGVIRWDGRQFHQSLPFEAEVGQLAKIGNTIMMGSGRGSVIYYDPPNWRRLPIDLDEAFLDQ